MIVETLSIARRFCGPPKSGNGGYVCGRLAKHLHGPTAVRLRVPPPLETEMLVEASENRARLLRGTIVIAEAQGAEIELAALPAPSFPEAVEAARSYLGFIRHSFPRCFVCGPQRTFGDGMRIFPGLIEARSIVAAPWIPDASLAERSGTLAPEFIWAALDCPSGFAVLPVPEGKTLVLGELCARVGSAVRPGDRCVVIGWPLHVDGRKRYAGSAIFTESGDAVAVGRATWIEVPVTAFTSESPRGQ